MSLRLQAAVEFITSYGVVLLIIAIAIAVLLVFGNAPTQSIPTSCSIYGTFKCADLAYGGNTFGGTRLEVLASSQVQGVINISSFSAVVGGIGSTSGFCSTTGKRGSPTSVAQGNQIYCVATFPNNVVVSQTYTGTFNMTGNYCPGTQTTCPRSGSTYKFSGSFRTVGVSNAVITVSTTLSTASTTTSSTTVVTVASSSSVSTTVSTVPTTTTTTSTSTTSIFSTTTIPCVSYTHVYVGNNWGSSVVDVNPTTYAINTVVSGGSYTAYALSDSPDGSYLYVSSVYGFSSQLSRVSTSNDVVVGTIAGAGSLATVATSPDGKTLYVPNAASGTVSVVNVSSGNVVNTITVPGLQSSLAEPFAVAAISPDGKTLYVGRGDGSAVYSISTASNALTMTISGLSGPYGIVTSPNGSRLYVTDSSTKAVSVINATTGNIISTIPLGTIQIASDVLSPDGSKLYVAGFGELYTISTSSYQVINTVVAGPTSCSPCHTSPVGLAISPDGNYIYLTVSNSYLDTISTTTNAILNQLTVGSGPGSVIVPSACQVSPTTSSTTTTTTTSTSTTSTTSATSTILFNNIYCVGGYLGTAATNSTYTAPLSGSGIGSWTSTNPYPSKIFSQSCVSSGGYIYCVGGSNGGTIISNVYYAPLSGNGIGAWASTTPYPSQIEAENCVTANSYIYCVGGGSSSVYYAALSSNGVGAWTATSSYPVGISGPSCSVSGGYIFCAGGTSSVTRNPIDNVYSATIASNGIGTWTATTPYPIATSYNCIPSNGYIYCISSPYYPPRSYYAAVSGSSLGAWNLSTTYPKSGSYEIYLESCVPYNGYAYCVGGYSYIGASYLSNAYYATTSATGAGTWTATTPYPVGVGAQSCVYGSSSSQPSTSTTTTTTTTTTSTTSTSTTTIIAPKVVSSVLSITGNLYSDQETVSGSAQYNTWYQYIASNTLTCPAHYTKPLSSSVTSSASCTQQYPPLDPPAYSPSCTSTLTSSGSTCSVSWVIKQGSVYTCPGGAPGCDAPFDGPVLTWTCSLTCNYTG
jgi:YVTN family beta-propeller protein